MKQVAQQPCGTDTPACPESRSVCALGFLRALGCSLARRPSPELEGAPPLVCKGGLLRSNATNSLFFALSEAHA